MPVFLYLFLVAENYGWAVAVLAIGGTTDWVDGFLSRAWDRSAASVS